MSQERLILAIGRIERALSRIEQAPIPASSALIADNDLAQRHEKLKAETRAALNDIDRLIAKGAA
jgi:hypothetical protein